MLLIDLLETSIRQIYRNKRRYKGAVIGTALGIAGLIVVATIGESVESAIGRNLEMLGSATIVKAAWDHRSQTWHKGQYYESDVVQLRQLPGIMQVSPTVWKAREQIDFQKSNMKARIGGVEANFFETLHLPVAKGRSILPPDAKERRQICIIGETIEKEFFHDGHAVGNAILVQGLSFEVIGVLGGTEDPEYMETVLIPLTVAKTKLKNMTEITDIYIRAIDWDAAPQVHRAATYLLRKNHPGYAEAMQITYYADRISAIKTVVLIFKLFLYGAIAVTLILGGLGITNVMLAIVNERTREIGLREALGATEPMIMRQFLCESLAVSLVGASIGITVGITMVQTLNSVIGTYANNSVFVISIFLAVAIGIILGVVSGLIPARRAGKLNAVEAMKFE
ncbi:ABC transporter permease [Desulfomonile tiedjei]|uniref:ABC-type antimicrobial peptide transport system, permease component n=1 Tax=Desulfomonile tiedjei (strain ATCC 49306 / DSM 6799 / DCB-1) TaxID=706587 RepID=I4C2K8_DESTA|nr:ABC transporter permease [Desulfomonile tiedjei]AFM23799.1 ABC-type antimicrobial peptide transport system, permease component [Desulfomonile tiedjei DSM 6799]